MTPILLDTCALIWITEGRLSAEADEALAERRAADVPIHISPVSAWEVGMLVARGRLALNMDAQRWFDRVVAVPGTAIARLPAETLIASSFLPGRAPRDPADRIIVASARGIGAVLMTRDRALLQYAAEGHVAALPC